MEFPVLFLIFCSALLMTYLFWKLLVFLVFAFLIIVSIAFGFFNAILLKGNADIPLFSLQDFKNTGEKHQVHSDIPQQKPSVVLTRNLDDAIQKLIDLIIRDFVLSWYGRISPESEIFSDIIKREFQIVLENVSHRIEHVDKAAFLSVKCVTAISDHLEEIQHANERSREGKLRSNFTLHPCLKDETSELQYLRMVADTFVMFLAPKCYGKFVATRSLFREILACRVFKPAIDLVTDPHYLNSTLYNWLLYREQLQRKQIFATAASYVELISSIKSCGDLELLKQMRLNIISEIMLSTTLKKIKQSRGIDADKRFSPESTERGELLYSRNLPKYISQLKVAKSMCERRIHGLGGAEYLSYVEESQQQENIPGKKILSFQVIMQSEEVRTHFTSFLRKTDKDCLVRFWEAIEDMRKATRQDQYRLANQISETFLSQKSSLLLQTFNSAIFLAMKSFLTGDEGPEGFWESQLVVYNFMEEKFYGSFIASDLYHQQVSELSDDLISSDVLDSVLPSTDEERSDDLEEKTENKICDIVLNSSYAEEKLKILENRIQNKRFALEAAQEFQKSNPQKQLEVMNAELEAMIVEQKRLKYHIEQTSRWMHYLGEWKAYICDADAIHTGNKDVAIFVIVVNLIGITKKATFEELSSAGSTDAWVITRRLEDFEELQRELIPIVPSIQRIRIPSRVNPNVSASLQKAREVLQIFLTGVLADEVLAQSEPVFTFFNKSLEFVKQSTSDKELKNSRTVFSTSEIFKKVALSIDRLAGSRSRDESDKDVSSSDISLQPLYNLIANVFELTGLSNWLRRTLVAVVQVTYGKSINKKVQETVDWLVSEPMLIYYLNLFRDAYWPNGKLAGGETEPPNDEQKHRMQILARQKSLQNIPAALRNLFGEDNSRRGALKVFEAFQNSQLNKHIFYTILDMFMKEVFGR